MVRLNTTYWQYGLSSDLGTDKNVNEDKVFIRLGEDSIGRKFLLSMIADGLSGHDDGELASKAAVEEVKKWWDKRIYELLKLSNAMEQIEEELDDVFHQINEMLIEIGEKENKKVGTTLSLLFLIDNNYLVVHIGDTRIHYIRKKHVEPVNRYSLEFNQITEDHKNPGENVLLQCLGINSELSVYKRQGTYKTGDIFLLTTDGMHNAMTTFNFVTIFYAFYKVRDLQRMSDLLVDLVRKLGAKEDDVSTILIRRAYISIGIFRKIFNTIATIVTKIYVYTNNP